MNEELLLDDGVFFTSEKTILNCKSKSIQDIYEIISDSMIEKEQICLKSYDNMHPKDIKTMLIRSPPYTYSVRKLLMRGDYIFEDKPNVRFEESYVNIDIDFKTTIYLLRSVSFDVHDGCYPLTNSSRVLQNVSMLYFNGYITKHGIDKLTV